VTRPSALLPATRLLLISVYWFGINAVWGGYEWFGQAQVELLAGTSMRGTMTGLLEMLGALVAIAVVPTAGVISDYTTTRFGRRKGYIITGASLDLVFLAGLALLAVAEPPGWDGEALGTPAVLFRYGALFLSLQASSTWPRAPTRATSPTSWQSRRWASPAASWASCARSATSAVPSSCSGSATHCVAHDAHRLIQLKGPRSCSCYSTDHPACREWDVPAGYRARGPTGRAPRTVLPA
jgi:hypothetical protein